MQQKTFHIIGICGIGMSGIAQVLKSQGHNVQGSDISTNCSTESLLQQIGIKVFKDHKGQNIKNADVIVKSTAISNQNPEILEAKNLAKPILERFEILNKILFGKKVIAVSGSHGKTTTTALIATIFEDANLDPTIICGAIINRFKNNVKIGKSNLFIVEADESDGTFYKIKRDLAVITNIDLDHLDFYQNEQNIKNAFKNFIKDCDCILPRSAFDICGQKKSGAINFYDFDQKTKTKKLLKKQAKGWQTKFKYALNQKKAAEITLNMPGAHNVQNAMAAIDCADYYGIDPEVIKNSVAKFCGTKRRLTHIANFNGNKVIDDYAHHPEAISATLTTLKAITKNIIAVIEPHRYSRVKDFFMGYINSFKHAKHIILLEVFSAGEANNGFDSRKLQKHAKIAGIDNIFLCSQNNQEHINGKITQIDQKDGLIVFMGAGKISYVAADFALFAKSICKRS